MQPNSLSSLIAEVDALKQHLASLPQQPAEAAQKVRDALAVAYTYENNRIVGNTLTLQEINLVVCEGLTLGGRTMREHLEVLNHYEAIDFIRTKANEQAPITIDLICDIHALVLRGIDSANAGKWREEAVVLSRSEYAPPTPNLLPQLMDDFVKAFEQLEQSGEHPLLLAAYLHDELVRIHPFIDGNRRTARLLMNLYLLRFGYLIVSIKGSPESRQRYFDALEESHLHLRHEAFHRLNIEAEKDALEYYINLVEY